MSKIKVAVNGYGTIGKRVAYAVSKQDDMEVVGVAKTRPTFEARDAATRGFPIYVPADSVEAFAKAGIDTAGTIDDMIQAADIIVDCTPGTVGPEYKAKYQAAGKKAIFQGGEEHGLTGLSFNSTANYQESWGAQFSRVVSCNTTGLLRTVTLLDKEYKIVNAYVTIVRRAADPGDSKTGPINALEPSVSLPTHHGTDVKSVLPWVDITSMAIKVPTTLMHIQTVVAKLGREVTTEEIVKLFSEAPRVRLVSSKEGVKSTAQVMEMARDIGRDRSDMYEIVVWKDGIKVVGDTLYYYQAVHQESDVIPENVDCIRSMFKLMPREESVAKTNKSLGICH